MFQIVTFNGSAGLDAGTCVMEQLAQGVSGGQGDGIGVGLNQHGTEKLDILAFSVELADSGFQIQNFDFIFLKGGFHLIFQFFLCDLGHISGNFSSHLAAAGKTAEQTDHQQE